MHIHSTHNFISLNHRKKQQRRVLAKNVEHNLGYQVGPREEVSIC